MSTVAVITDTCQFATSNSDLLIGYVKAITGIITPDTLRSLAHAVLDPEAWGGFDRIILDCVPGAA